MKDVQGGQMLHIGNLLSDKGVALSLKARNRDEVLRELITLIPALADRPAEREKLFHALKEREELCSTGIGDGVALPHARNAMVGLVDEPVIVFGRKVEGMHYASIDGAAVKLFFLLIAPNVTTHLRILARLSRLLRNPHVRNSLLTAESVSRVLSIIKVNEVDLDSLPSH
ncbi:MAG TPA: PTS fructose transporter subunit IIA [Verrucomicrobiales bacterium]|nr:PTS fructose transporter subunit IIA [Verrucomicrobiales bacterium]